MVLFLSVVKKVAKNTLVLTISQVIALASGFVYFVYMARYLGIENFGLLTFALAITSILGIIADFGLGQLIIREVARNRGLADKYLKNATGVKIALGFLFILVIFLVLKLLNYQNNEAIVVFFIALSVLINSFNQIHYSIFSAYEKMEYKAFGEIIYSCILLGGVFFIVHESYNITYFALLYAISSLIVLIYTIIIMNWKFIRTGINFEKQFIKVILKQAMPFGLSAIFVSIFYQIDSIMLSVLDGNQSVGIYNAAYRLIFAILTIRTIVHSSIFPLLSRSFTHKSNDQFKIICSYLFKYLLIIIIPIALGTTILADNIIYLIYGMDYIDSAIVLQILIWSNVIIFFNLYPRLFEVANKQVVLTKITLIGALLNIVLNYIMIPHWSYIGASVATVCTEFVILIISYKIATPNIYDIKKSEFINFVSSILFSGFVMGLFTNYFSHYNLMFVVVGSGLIYIFMLYITKVIGKHDYYIFKSIFVSN